MSDRGLRHRQVPPAHALGTAAADAGYRVKYTLATKLVNELVEAADERQLAKTIARYGRVDLLCIDELGYMELDRRGAELLFQVLTEREGPNSVAIASNESFSGWTKTFTDPRLCAAIVDRLTFGGHIMRPAPSPTGSPPPSLSAPAETGLVRRDRSARVCRCGVCPALLLCVQERSRSEEAQAGSQELADAREEVADLRSEAADRREAIDDKRERVLGDVYRREQAAGERDRAADARDVAADERERVADAPGAEPSPNRGTPATDRGHSAIDRTHSGRDRDAGAGALEEILQLGKKAAAAAAEEHRLGDLEHKLTEEQHPER